jgi:hypothetical protein
MAPLLVTGLFAMIVIDGILLVAALIALAKPSSQK